MAVALVVALLGCASAPAPTPASPSPAAPSPTETTPAPGSSPAPDPRDAWRPPAELRPRKTVRAHRGDLAVVIGVEHYRRGVGDATGAARDARLFAAYAERTLGVPRDRIRLLVDEQATRSSVDGLLDEWLVKNASKDGIVYVYFAGHGTPDPQRGAYLLPWDGDPKYVKSSALSVARVTARLESLKARHVVVMLDACFTGAASRGARTTTGAGTRPIVVTSVRVDAPQLTLFTAAGPGEITGAGPSGHGLFTYHLLRGLGGAADDDGNGKVTLAELGAFVQRGVRDGARLENREQTPQLVGTSGLGLVMSETGGEPADDAFLTSWLGPPPEPARENPAPPTEPAPAPPAPTSAPLRLVASGAFRGPGADASFASGTALGAAFGAEIGRFVDASLWGGYFVVSYDTTPESGATSGSRASAKTSVASVLVRARGWLFPSGLAPYAEGGVGMGFYRYVVDAQAFASGVSSESHYRRSGNPPIAMLGIGSGYRAAGSGLRVGIGVGVAFRLGKLDPSTFDAPALDAGTRFRLQAANDEAFDGSLTTALYTEAFAGYAFLGTKKSPVRVDFRERFDDPLHQC